MQKSECKAEQYERFVVDGKITMNCKFMFETSNLYLVTHQGVKMWVAKSQIIKTTTNSITIKVEYFETLLKKYKKVNRHQ